MDRVADAQADNFQATLLWTRRECKRSIIQQRRAILKDPSNYLANLSLACSFAREEKYDAAIKEYQTAILINPTNITPYSSLAEIFHLQGAYDKEATMYGKLVDIEPSNYWWYLSWGNCLSKGERYTEAVEKYAKVLERNPWVTQAYNGWAMALYAKQEYESAVSQCVKAMGAHEINPETYLNWGLCLYQQYKDVEAYKMFDRCADLLRNMAKDPWKVIEKLCDDVIKGQDKLASLSEENQIKHWKRHIKGINEIIKRMKKARTKPLRYIHKQALILCLFLFACLLLGRVFLGIYLA